MWILIDGIACGESTITCVLYERTKSLGKTGEYLWWSRPQDFPFNLLISEVSLFYSPNPSVLLWFWSVSFGDIEIWEKWGENWTMSLFHCSHRSWWSSVILWNRKVNLTGWWDKGEIQSFPWRWPDTKGSSSGVRIFIGATFRQKHEPLRFKNQAASSGASVIQSYEGL